MLRFAASPTGDMNINHLRIALFNYIVSRQRGEDFIVRIEDIDKEKNIEGKDNEILDTLALFGVEYSQVIHQSQNIRFHSAMALQLLHEKKAFSCFCSSAWLNSKREEALAAKKTYKYDDACRNLPPELVIDNTNPFTIRINRPDDTITIHDKIKGDVDFKPDAIDSFIIMNQDKIPTHNFACGVDDMLNDINMIIESEEDINSTPKQDHIRNSLEYKKTIEYAHIPPIIGEPIPSIKLLLEEGFLPETILNYLISIGNDSPSEIFTLKEAIEWFDISKISSSPTRFDSNMLKHINREHLKNLDAKELSRYVGFADEEIGELARIYLEDVYTTKELKNKIAPIFESRFIPQELKEATVVIRDVLKSAPYFEHYDDFKNYIIKETGLKDEDYEKPMRILLSNAVSGPELAKIYKYIKNYLGEIIK